MRIAPYFELEGNKYEFRRTRWLIAEYKRLNEENPLSDEDKANAIKASNLVADVKKFAEKERELWEKLCNEPTEENQRVYYMFKGMSDKAIAEYNSFVATNDTLNNATKHSVDILEQVAIKALQEQHFGGNFNLAKQTWEMFVESNESNDYVAQWLMAFADSLFGNDEEDEDKGFLAEKRKADEARVNNRNNGFRKKR